MNTQEMLVLVAPLLIVFLAVLSLIAWGIWGNTNEK